MPSTVEYCLSNVEDVCAIRDRGENVPVSVQERRCLQRCGQCFADPFLVVDGNVVTGDSHEQLLTEVSQR